MGCLQKKGFGKISGEKEMKVIFNSADISAPVRWFSLAGRLRLDCLICIVFKKLLLFICRPIEEEHID